MNEKQAQEMLEILTEMKKGIDTLVAAQMYSAELEERMMKALSGDSKKSTAQRSIEQMERMGK
ncbi:MAG: hypothetical protein WKF67_07825 [Rubrobacteraceae bacterium]